MDTFIENFVMKKIFYASIALLLFSIALIITEISCQKTVAQSDSTSSNNNKGVILLSKQQPVKSISVVTGQDTVVHTELESYVVIDYFIADIDGSSQKQIPINLSGNLYVQGGGKITNDGTTLVFYAGTIPDYYSPNGYPSYIYSCSVNGSNLKKLYNSYPSGYNLDDVQ